MRYPIYVMLAITVNGVETFTRGIVDIHPASVSRVIEQPNGNTSVLTPEGWIEMFVPFDDVYKLMVKLGGVNTDYEDINHSYAKDVFVNLNKNRPNGRQATDKD